MTIRCLLVPALLCPTLAAAPKIEPGAANSVGVSVERLARIAGRMREFVDAGSGAGYVTLVARRGKLLALDAVGMRDIEAKAPMREDTIFQIMSMTKPVTATAVMMLAEEGRLSVFDPVEKHLPEFESIMLRDGEGRLVKPSRKITLRDLLTHTSGMAGGFPEQLSDRSVLYANTLAKNVAIYAEQALESEPGELWRYSNMGIASLGRIVEVVSGKPFERFLAERIFEPLGMSDTFFFPPKDKRNRIAAVYSGEESGLVRADRDLYRVGAKYPMPEGGLYSTAADLFRFYQATLNGGELDGARFLSPGTVKLMTQLHSGDLTAGFAPGMGFGFGWAVVRNIAGTFRGNSIGTFGHGGAFRTYGFVDPHKQLIGVILFQKTNGGGDMADEITAFIQMANAAIVE